MKRLLLAAAAMAAVVTPTLSSAQPMDGARGGGREGSMREGRGGGWEGRGDGGRRGAARPAEAAPPAQAAPAPAPAPRADRQAGQGRWSGRGDGGGRDWNQDRNRGPDRAGPDNRQRWDQGQRRDRDDGWTNNRGPDRPNVRPNDRWDSRGSWADRDDRRRYQSGGQRWSRSDRDWWRGRSDFRGYTGVRAGFWFAPSYGYYPVDPVYFGRTWRVGDYVPGAYRRYVVLDPFVYGLDWPPPGFDWIYLGNDIVLMDPVGRIAEVLRGVF